MKSIFKIFSIVAIMMVAIASCTDAQSKTTTTTKFKVLGNCEMCKKTIETSLSVKGVKTANWNVDTKIIEVVYQADKISEDKIHDLIAASGYETEKKKADKKAYSELPDCCQYTK